MLLPHIVIVVLALVTVAIPMSSVGVIVLIVPLSTGILPAMTPILTVVVSLGIFCIIAAILTRLGVLYRRLSSH